MSTRFLLSTLVLACLAASGPAVLASIGPDAQERDRNETTPEGCGRYQMQFDDREVARAEETVDVPRSSVERLRAQTGRGGVQIIGWTGDSYRVRACKAAAGATMSEAQARVAMMSLQVNGGEVSVTRPDGDDWLVHYIIQAPSGGAVSLEAANGPLSIRGFSGTADMVSRNGPISITQSAGHISARATNGPVSVSDSSGDITARTENGPVTVSLDNRPWQGGRLDASTQNGPLSFEIPSGYQAGVEVRMGRHSPFRCNSPMCRDTGARTWDDEGRRVVMGSEPAVVRLSTVNGPVTIAER